MNPPAPTEINVQALAETIFGKHDTPIFALLDGASAPQLVKNLHERKPEFFCLVPGALKPDMAVVAPYLAKLERGSEFTEWVLQEGWGAHWGLFVSSPADSRSLRDHFREFHKVELPDQRTVIFRYYDPRVLRIFLPVCNQQELAGFFGPVKSFLVEGDTLESGMRFTFTGQALKTDNFQLKKSA